MGRRSKLAPERSVFTGMPGCIHLDTAAVCAEIAAAIARDPSRFSSIPIAAYSVASVIAGEIADLAGLPRPDCRGRPELAAATGLTMVALTIEKGGGSEPAAPAATDESQTALGASPPDSSEAHQPAGSYSREETDNA